jgi:oligogalacturonide lyase
MTLKEKIMRQVFVVNVLIVLLVSFVKCSARNGAGGEPAEWIKFNDPRTGHEVWQMTSHDSRNEALYFYAPAFTADDKYVIFRSNRDGLMEMYRANLITGGITRLTTDGIDAGCIHPDGENMVYISGWDYYSMNVHTREKKHVMNFEDLLPSKPVFRPSLTSDGRYTIVLTQDGDDRRIYRVDLEKKEVLKVHEQTTGRFSHVLIHPHDPGIITYCPLPDAQNDMSLPMHQRARTKIVRVDKGTNEPYLVTPCGFRATHDSWAPAGNRYFFFEKTVRDWVPVSIGSVDINGENYTRHYTCDSIKLGHGMASQDGRWFISDGQASHDNPLILLNLEDGGVEFICWPDASVNTPARVHVHPNFSFSGNYAVYTSDVIRTERHQVYVVPLKTIKENWGK